jgi:hypothetical protein
MILAIKEHLEKHRQGRVLNAANYSLEVIESDTSRMHVKCAQTLTFRKLIRQSYCRMVKRHHQIYQQIIYRMMLQAVRSVALHRATSRGKSHHALFPFPEDAQMAMRGWRAMLYLISFDEPRYTRRMESFLPEYVFEFDAGTLLYKSQADGTEVALGGWAVDLRGLGFGSDLSSPLSIRSVLWEWWWAPYSYELGTQHRAQGGQRSSSHLG